MRQLTNEERKCFALAPVREEWELVKAKPGPYDMWDTYLYFDGDTIVKCILLGPSQYCEYELSEKVSPDRKYLLPKTQRGKPTLLSASSIQKHSGTGMRLSYHHEIVCLSSERNQCFYYSNEYLQDNLCDVDAFFKWVENWCKETADDDIANIVAFSQKERRHVRFKEGDVFRFKIGRRLYGYGRVLLDYDKMRKKKEAFWDILMCKPVVCSVYHIVTKREDVTLDELKDLPSLPSTIIADNSLYYGEYHIIGNISVGDEEDYPILYGDSIRFGEKAVCYQRGKTYRRIENQTELFSGYRNNGVSVSLNFTLHVLRQCIKKKSNKPYWKLYYAHFVGSDLRNPKNADRLEQIKKQFDL